MFLKSVEAVDSRMVAGAQKRRVWKCFGVSGLGVMGFRRGRGTGEWVDPAGEEKERQ